ncbi:hypothetical protein ILUMI_27078 [Ignelater luminosus]|uniref:DUF4817 domain-containing protein n=1 Tax=Ignelater luminosus TaxID=2038154 RepID=A0A8K0FVS1_IGNLU|nr:hypothetical protein ILUMI_27078 [Ignelater luminosus]
MICKNCEITDIPYVYGKADGNTREAQGLYRHVFPERQCPAKCTFSAIYRRLRETRSFCPVVANRGIERTARIPNLEMEVLDTIEEHPEKNTKDVVAEFQVST